MAQNFGLGRGLSSLIPQKRKSVDESGTKIDEPREDFNYFGSSSRSSREVINAKEKKADSSEVLEISIDDIKANPHQPRTNFDEEKLKELADSIKEHGIIQPVILSKVGDKFELIAGERRFQAAKLAGLLKLPAIVRLADEREKLELAIIENIQRQNLNPIEEANSYSKLSDEFNLSQEEIAKKIGQSRSSVANKIRLLNLPSEIKNALVAGKITEGHCKLLLAIPNPEKQLAFYEMIIKNSLTVRQTEDKTRQVSVRTHKRNITIDPEIKSLEDKISESLGTKVKIKKSGGGGKIIVDYYSQEELNSILEKIKP